MTATRSRFRAGRSRPGTLREFIETEFPETVLGFGLGQPVIEVCLECADKILGRFAMGFSVLHTRLLSFCSATAGRSNCYLMKLHEMNYAYAVANSEMMFGNPGYWLFLSAKSQRNWSNYQM